MQIPTLIYCANGNKRYADIAIRHGFTYGAQLPGTVYHHPYFADQDFKRPRYLKYIQALKNHRPELASVLDWEHEHRLIEMLMRAEEIAQYASEIMIIPKVIGGIERIPNSINGKPVRLGYSVPTGFGGTLVPFSEFGARPVHLLGGPPRTQFEIANTSGMNVVSVDGNSHKLKAQWAEFFTGNGYRQLQDIGYGHLNDANYHAFHLSCINIKAMWADVPATIQYAQERDLSGIENIVNQYKRKGYLDYVIYPALREAMTRQELYIALQGRDVVGFVQYYTRKDGWITVRKIGVHQDMTGHCIGKALLDLVPQPTRLKCTSDNPANEFFKCNGFTLVRTESGINRALNIWEKR